MLHIPSALLYALMGTAMVFANKFLLNYWNFSYPMLIVSAEMFLNAFFICTFSKLNIIEHVNLNVFEVIRRDKNNKFFVGAALFYLMHSISSLKALSKMNIPMYVIFKRCAPLVNLLLSGVCFQNNVFTNKSKHSTKIVISILLMTLGVVIAGVGDITFDLTGYLYCGFSVICQSLYFTSIQKCSETQKNSFQVLLACSFIALPILIFTVVFSGEFEQLILHKEYKEIENPNFWLSYLMVVCCGAVLCFSQFWCTMTNNAITTSVIGVLKSVVQTGLGMVLFGGFLNLNSLTVIGTAINIVFGTWYAYLKYIDKGDTGTKQVVGRRLVIK